MLLASRQPIFTPRLELRRTRVEDAAAMFEAMRHREIYRFIPRSAPESAAELARRFARVIEETAEGRAEQWLNWTVWLCATGAPLGTIEATIGPDQKASIGYLFDPRTWRRGYAREAVAAMLDHLSAQGALSFEATIDVRNQASKALAARLGFKLVDAKGVDETWLRAG